MNIISDSDKWPRPQYDENNQPHFLFIITPPFSGSTALSELLNTSHRTMILQERGEGQWLIPGLSENDRWDPNKEIDYLSVKAVWLNKFQEIQKLTQNIDVVIEKSPPNIMRIENISRQFKNYSFIANNRDPYANCASILYRNHNVKQLKPEERIDIVKKLARNWLMRSDKIQELVLHLDIPLLTYEDFCKNPESILDNLKLPDGVAQSINFQAEVKVKDYEKQGIVNQNERQIAKLTDEDINNISDILKSNEKLLDFFGYEILN